MPLLQLHNNASMGGRRTPTLAEKAAIIFYMVNRRHIFPNGNKRLSTLCLLTFLIGNDAQLDVSPHELTEKACGSLQRRQRISLLSRPILWRGSRDV